jgi:hypothetical protein
MKRRDVASWPEADIQEALIDVCLRGVRSTGQCNGPHRHQPFRIVGTGSRNHVLRDHYDPFVVRGKNVPEDLAATLSPTDSVPLGGRSW